MNLIADPTPAFILLIDSSNSKMDLVKFIQNHSSQFFYIQNNNQ